MPSKTTLWRDGLTDERRAAYEAQQREDVRARHRASGYAAQYAWERRNPDKRAAMVAVRLAVKAGKLTREPCLFCGAEKVEAHHHSYDPADRLVVTWLCRRHHRRVHRGV